VAKGVVCLSHLKYNILGYVTEDSSLILEIGCQCKTVQEWRKSIKAGDFEDEKEFIATGWPYFLAVEKDLKRMKKEPR
jgi:hypothetical protein